jgi:hypothetical protein
MRKEYEELIGEYESMMPFMIQSMPERVRTYLPLINNGGDGRIYTHLKDYIAGETGDSESTVRWNMNRMKELGLITTGTIKTKGTPTRVTKRGHIVLKCLNGKKFVNPI